MLRIKTEAESDRDPLLAVPLVTRRSIDHVIDDETGQSGKLINCDIYYPKCLTSLIAIDQAGNMENKEKNDRRGKSFILVNYLNGD